MVYFRPGEWMRMMYYSRKWHRHTRRKEIRVLISGFEPKTFPITSSDALPLSYRRLVGAKAIKLGVRFFGRIRKRICDLRSFGSCRIKGTNESTLDKDSSVPLMRHDPNDLRSQIRFRILPKKPHHRFIYHTFDIQILAVCRMFVSWT